MILESHGKIRNLRALNLVRLQKQRSIEVVGLLKTLKIIIVVSAKTVIGDPQQPQEIEKLRATFHMVIIPRVIILQESLEQIIIKIRYQDFMSVRIQHQDLAITVMVALEETMTGGRVIFECGGTTIQCGGRAIHTALFGPLQLHLKIS